MRLRLEDGIRWESHEQIEELNLRPGILRRSSPENKKL